MCLPVSCLCYNLHINLHHCFLAYLYPLNMTTGVSEKQIKVLNV